MFLMLILCCLVSGVCNCLVCPVLLNKRIVIVFTSLTTLNPVDFQLFTMVQTIKDIAKGFFHGKLIDLVDEELVSN